MDEGSERAASLLRGGGLRVTAPRVAALRALSERGHLSADDVAVAVRTRVGSVSTQSAYDGLRAFTDAGIVRRIEPDGSPALYELRVGDNHHHVICRICQAIEDVDCATGSKPCLDPVDAHGYRIDEAEVIYWGTCPACAATNRRPITKE